MKTLFIRLQFTNRKGIEIDMLVPKDEKQQVVKLDDGTTYVSTLATKEYPKVVFFPATVVEVEA